MRYNTERQPVSALALFRNPDIQGYLYNQEAEEMGLDGWTAISGVDANQNESQIILEYGSTEEKIVSPDFIVYVGKNEYCITDDEKADQRWKSQ